MKTISMASPLNATGIASISSHKPSRLYHRQNYLRPKILRTLKKPNPPPPPPPPTPPPPPSPPLPTTTPLVVHERTVTEELAAENNFIEEITPAVEVHQDGELQATSLSFGELFSKPVLKYGAYLLAAFLFQTIFSALILGSSDSSSTSEVSDEKRKGNVLINGNGKGYESRIISKTSNAMNVDEAVIESRIEEIRSLARQVRRAESKQLVSEVGTDGNDAVVSASRDYIEKEIASGLNKLQNKLNSAKKPPVLSKSAPVKGVNGSRKVDDNLMFKKKTKVRSLSKDKSNLSSSPIGFSGSEGRDADTNTRTVDMSVENGWSKDSKLEQSQQTDRSTSVSGPRRSVSPKAMIVEDTESKNGAMGKPSQVSSSVPQSPRGFGRNAKAEGGRKFRGAASRATNRNLKSNNLAMKKGESKQQKHDGANMWWLSLPCVYVILMRRGPEYGGLNMGFYTLESGDSDEDDEGFIVGFEDRTDANNFCLVLESFFEELGDFNADVVPLLRKELVEIVKVDSMKMIVARKGQLRLYAGQPLSEVDSALMSLA